MMASPPKSRESPLKAGTKRKRESSEDQLFDSRPIKKEPSEPVDEDSWNDDFGGPPTPPIPRNTDQERHDEFPVQIKREREVLDEEINDEHNGAECSNDPTIKTESQDTGANDSDGTCNPKITNFFSFASAPQAEATMPNSMAADIKVIPNEVPHEADYRSLTNAEEEQKYKIEKEAVKTIPLFEETIGSDSEAEDVEKDDSKTNNVPTASRYFMRSSVYSKYNFQTRRVDASRLAVHEKKTHILSSLEKSRVIIVEGFTGCGKTTQVPQYILDSCAEKNAICNIVVTQPRKIAAVSVARRVSYERNWNLGSVVGYQVGMEAKVDRNDTLLTFMTTGVLLQKLISMKSLKDYTHIIIDEVHERDLDTDMLLLVIKRIMSADTNGVEKHVKLILMSATIETKTFENYYIFTTNDGDEVKPRVIKIPFVARHRVEEYFLDDICCNKMDLFDQIQCNLELSKATLQEEVFDVALGCVKHLDDMEREQNPDPRLRGRHGYAKLRGAVLVFLPGMEEIRNFQRVLNGALKDQIDNPENTIRDPNFYRWTILPLHSSVTSEEQAKVFEPSDDTFRKIILSTNISESSVTVPDIAYVIDFCLTKSNCIDQSTNFTTLRMSWASKSQCVQRKGRSGRVSDGKVYRLVPRDFYHRFNSEILPEMKRSNLETVILLCKKFDLDTPKNLLRDALDGPDVSGIKRAVSTLKELGALTITQKDKSGKMTFTYEDGDLTFLGKVMTDLPIAQQCTRLIMFGYAFGVLHEAIIIAAALSVKNPFYSGFQKQMDTYLKKVEFSHRSFSDLFALYHVYKFWISTYAEGGDFGRLTSLKRHREREWARGAQIQLGILREIKSLVELLEDRLKRLGITTGYTVQSSNSNDDSRSQLHLSQEQGIFLKLAIAGAFYPRYFLRRRPEPKQYEREASRAVLGHNPYRTIYFRGFPQNQEGKLYAKYVADYLACGTSIPEIKFDGQKVLAIFDNSTSDTIGCFNKGIFRAVKLRQLRENLEFRVLWKEHELQEIERWQEILRARRHTPCPPLTPLPPVNVSEVQVEVQHINHPSQFWVVFKHHSDEINLIGNVINDNQPDMIPLPRSKMVPNALCLAPFEHVHYRAKILRQNNDLGQSLVYFVDYGNSCWVRTSVLTDFSPAMVAHNIHKKRCLAVECRLSNLKPVIIHSSDWSREAIQVMETFRSRAPALHLKIYSVDQSIISCELLGSTPGSSGPPYSLHQQLCKTHTNGRKYAEPAKENFSSEENHRKRLRAEAGYIDDEVMKAINCEQIADVVDLDFIEPPRRNAHTPITLKGPYSPLEMSFQALVSSSNTKEVRVENSSVNSVLLDHELTDPNSRMLVAAHVGIADKSGAVVARDSTVMPAVPNILGLVAMIFAPTIELRVDKDQSRYTGILCGCGIVPDSTNLSIHPDNDMEIIFDTVIDDDDVDRANKIRYNMDLILRKGRGVNNAEYHKQLGLEIVKFLQKQRKLMDSEIWPQEEYVWNRISQEFLQPPNPPGMHFIHEDIFQPHRKVFLNRVEVEEVRWNFGY